MPVAHRALADAGIGLDDIDGIAFRDVLPRRAATRDADRASGQEHRAQNGGQPLTRGDRSGSRGRAATPRPLSQLGADPGTGPEGARLLLAGPSEPVRPVELRAREGGLGAQIFGIGYQQAIAVLLLLIVLLYRLIQQRRNRQVLK